jgi:hypothetical protein
LADFHKRHAAQLNEITESLRRYFPSELELLELLARGDEATLEEWGEAYPTAINHLAGYGVLDNVRMQIRIAPLQRLLQS